MSDIKELARRMAVLREEYDALKQRSAEVYKEWDRIRKVDLPEAMEEAGLESARVEGVGTLSMRTDAYVRAKEGKQMDLQEWLESIGHGDLVKPTVNSSSLKALLKELAAEGEDIPDDLVKFEPYTYVAITGAKK